MRVPKNPDCPTDSDLSLSQPRSTTRCAILTGAGRSAVAVVGVQGPGAAKTISARFTPKTSGPFHAGQIRYGSWDGEAIVVTPLEAESFEIHCHGGPLAAKRIVESLTGSGIEAVQGDDWNVDRVPLLIREARQVLSRCQTARLAAIALDQTRGALLSWCERLITELRKLDEDLPVEYRERIKCVADRGQLGARIDVPFRVVLVGPPNVGKSSLVNAIVGYDRSITMDVAGTTRDVLHAETVIDGLPIRLSDTAGMRESIEPIEQQGIELAKRATTTADLVVIVSDPQQQSNINASFARSVHVMNKADLLDGRSHANHDSIRTIATTGQGVAELMNAIAATLATNFPQPGDPVPITSRQVDCLRQASAADEVSSAIDHLRRLMFGTMT